MIKKQCVCGNNFNTYPSRVADGRGVYCSRKCSDKVTLIKKGQKLSEATQFGNIKPYNFKGFRFSKSRKDGRVYKLIFKPDHPNATKAGYVREHRLVMEHELGRYLTCDEIVDHIDRFDTLNNHPSNLRVMKKVEHDRMNVTLNIHRRWYE